MADKKGYVNGVRVYREEGSEMLVLDFERTNEVCPRVIRITEAEVKNLGLAVGLFFHNEGRDHG